MNIWHEFIDFENYREKTPEKFGADGTSKDIQAGAEGRKPDPGVLVPLWMLTASGMGSAKLL